MTPRLRGLIAGEWQSWDLNSGLASEPELLSPEPRVLTVDSRNHLPGDFPGCLIKRQSLGSCPGLWDQNLRE